MVAKSDGQISETVVNSHRVKFDPCEGSERTLLRRVAAEVPRTYSVDRITHGGIDSDATLWPGETERKRLKASGYLSRVSGIEVVDVWIGSGGRVAIDVNLSEDR
jgi:hypothetical protein